MNLIDKDVLVAEIKERIETYNKGYANGDDRRADALDLLLHYINTLEVKEVDLEKFDGLEDSIIEFLSHVPENEPDHSETLYTYEQMQEIARHFAQWQKEQTINKACEWLVYNVNGSVYYDDFDNAFVDTDELITVFKEAMNND